MHASDHDLQVVPISQSDQETPLGELKDMLQRNDLLWNHFDETGDLTLLDDWISLQKEILKLCPVDDAKFADHCENLSTLLFMRFQQGEDVDVLDECIRLLRETLRLRPTEDAGREQGCGNLAICLKIRFSQTGDYAMHDDVVKLQREVLQMLPSGHPTRAIACGNLASSLLYQFERSRDQALLDEAVSLHREAMEFYFTEDVWRAGVRVNLASVLSLRFEQTGDESALEEAITLNREALQLLPERSSDCANIFLNYAITLKHFLDLKRDGDDDVLKEAIDVCKEALESWPVSNSDKWRPLLLLTSLYLYSRNEPTDTETAVRMIYEAVSSYTHDFPGLLKNASDCLRQTCLTDNTESMKEPLLQCYSAVIDLALLVAGFVLDHATQLEYLAHCRYLGSGVYSTALLANQLDYGLQLLERARGVVWTQLLHLRDPHLQDLENTHPRLAAELGTLLQILGSYRADDRVTVHHTELAAVSYSRDERHQKHDRVQQIIREVRSLPGFSNFMSGPSQQDLRKLASTHPVIVLVPTEVECHALIITSPEVPPVDILLHGVSAHAVDIAEGTGMWGTSLRSLDWRSLHMRDEVDGRYMTSHKSSKKSALQKLWEAVVKPVINYLRLRVRTFQCVWEHREYRSSRTTQKATGFQRPRIHWCPTGAFSFVPVHAAGIYDGPNQECCSDYVVSSYTPTLAALHKAQQTTQTLSTSQLKLLMVALETTPGLNLRPLPNVRTEAANIVGVAEKRQIKLDVRQDAPFSTITEVATSLESANLVHLACHGTQHPTNPLESGFCLSNGILTVEELMKLDLKNAFFAFLSACETAKGDKEQPDQTIHLAATLLFTGFQSVVATMWYVILYLTLNKWGLISYPQDNEGQRRTLRSKALLRGVSEKRYDQCRLDSVCTGPRRDGAEKNRRIVGAMGNVYSYGCLREHVHTKLHYSFVDAYESLRLRF
jgi:hypothetical protein